MTGNIWASLLWRHLDILFWTLVGLGAVAVCYAIYLTVRLATARSEANADGAKRGVRRFIMGFIILFMVAPTALMVGCNRGDPYIYKLMQDYYSVAEVDGGAQVQLLQGTNPVAIDQVRYEVSSATESNPSGSTPADVLEITPQGMLTVKGALGNGANATIRVNVWYNDETRAKLTNKTITVYNPSVPGSGNEQGGDPGGGYTPPIIDVDPNALFWNPVNYMSESNDEHENFGYGSRTLPFVTTYFGEPMLNTTETNSGTRDNPHVFNDHYTGIVFGSAGRGEATQKIDCFASLRYARKDVIHTVFNPTP